MLPVAGACSSAATHTSPVALEEASAHDPKLSAGLLTGRRGHDHGAPVYLGHRPRAVATRRRCDARCGRHCSASVRGVRSRGGATADRRGRLPRPAAGRRRSEREGHAVRIVDPRARPARADRGGRRGVLDRRPRSPRHAARRAGGRHDRLLAARQRDRLRRSSCAHCMARVCAPSLRRRDRHHGARPRLRGRRDLVPARRSCEGERIAQALARAQRDPARASCRADPAETAAALAVSRRAAADARLMRERAIRPGGGGVSALGRAILGINHPKADQDF